MDLIQVLQKSTERILLTQKELGLGSGNQMQQPKMNHSLKLVGVILSQFQKQCRLHTERILTIKSKGVWPTNTVHHTSDRAKKMLHSQSVTLMRLGKRRTESFQLTFAEHEPLRLSSSSRYNPCFSYLSI